MSSATTTDNPSVFDVEDTFNIPNSSNTFPASTAIFSDKTAVSPSSFLNNLSESASNTQASASTFATANSSTPKENNAGFIPAISPTFMLSSIANSSPVSENIMSSAKERLSQIRPWKDFFSIDQFHIPESSTAAQSRASHNFTHFQNNYLIIMLLLCGFSLLSDISLLMVAAVILGGFYYLSTLNPDFTLKVGGQEINRSQLNYGWIVVSIIMLYMSSALSVVFWIISVSAVITITHAALHDIAIENEFNSV